jgi:hypothetical protein
MNLPTEDDLVRRMAARCGDCKRLLDDIAGDHVYMRMQPARLICLDCKLREPPR